MPTWNAGPGKVTMNTNAKQTSGVPERRADDLRAKYTTGQPVSDAQWKHIDNMAQFFGNPLPGRAANMPNLDWDYERENNDYPEAFNALWGDGNGNGTLTKNGHMSQVMIEKIKACDEWPLTRMAPLLKWETSLTFSWNITIFNRHMLDKVPEESSPRLLTSTRSGGSTSMSRYGIAMLLECTFAETEIGQQTFFMNKEQMRIATVETMSYGAMVSIMEWKPYEDPQERFLASNAMTVNDLNKLFRAEVDNWARVHKSPHGFDKCMSQMNTVLKNRQVERKGIFVLPDGMVKFMHEAEPNWLRDGPGSSNPNPGKYGEYVESRPFSRGEHTPGEDPLFRAKTIGSFFTLDDKGNSYANYKTRHLDTIIQNEDGDCLSRLEYSTLYRYAGIWDFSRDKAPLTDLLGQGFVDDIECYTYGQAYRKCSTKQQDRAVEAIMQLPAHKQQEFLGHAHLLPEEHRDTCGYGAEKADYPGQGDKDFYDPDAFDEIAMGDLQRAPQFNAAKQRHCREKRAREPGTTDAEVLQYERHLDEQKENMDEDERKYPAAGQQRRVVAVRSRPKTLKDVFDGLLQHSGAVQPGQEAAVTQVIERYHEALKTWPLQHASSALDVAKHFSSLVARHAKARQADSGTVTALSLAVFLQCHFVPWVAKLEPQLCVSDVLSAMPFEATPLENANRDASQPLHREYPDTTLTSWWQPNGHAEPGQLSLFTGLTDVRVALPHDAFAATLAAKHTVLFQLEEDAKTIGELDMNGASMRGLTRVRRNALTWSIVLSMLHAVRTAANGTDAKRTATAAFLTTLNEDNSKAILDRLKAVCRVATDRPTLVSQVHLRSYIQHLSTIVRTFVTAPVVAAMADADDEEKEVPQETRAAAVVQVDSDIIPVDSDVADALDDAMNAAAADDGENMDLLGRIPDFVAIAVRDASAREKRDLGALELATFGLMAAEFAGEDSDAQDAWMQTHEDLLVHVSRTIESELADILKGDARKQASATSDAASFFTLAYVVNILNLASLLSGALYKFFIDNDIPLPFFLRAWKPNATYLMGSILYVGSGAANTVYQNPHFMMADNAAQKMIYGHFTLYSKTIVFNPQKVLISHNAFCKDYLGGNGIEVWNPLDPDHVQAYNEGRMANNSIFVTMGLMSQSLTATFWLSVTGTMPDSLSCAEDVNGIVDYPGCNAFAEHWDYKTNMQDRSPNAPYSTNSDPNERKYNTICMQGFQMKADEDGKHTVRVENQGHWGKESWYPGAAEVMRGAKAYFTPPQYQGSIGG